MEAHSAIPAKAGIVGNPDNFLIVVKKEPVFLDP